VDLDIVCKTNFLSYFSFVENEEVVLANTPGQNQYKGQCLTNSIMMSQKGSEFWRETWINLTDPFRRHSWKRIAAKLFPYFRVLFVTGPGIVSDAFDYYDKSLVYVSSSKILQPASYRDKKPFETHESVVKVLEGSSWHGGKGANHWFNLLWFTRNSVPLMVSIIMIMFIVIIGLSVWIHKLRKM
jgi:hypothetical protein